MRHAQPGGLPIGARTVLLPVGSCEQHGPHLPFATDHLIAQAFAEAVLERWGVEYGLVAVPGIPYGLSLEHAWAEGTLTLPARSYLDLITALCASIGTSLRPKAIVIVNGHGGNIGALESVIREISHGTGIFTCAVNPLALSRVDLNSPEPDIHAATAETSVMLHLHPSMVGRPPAAPAPPKASQIRALVLDRGVLWPWHTMDETIAGDGIIGDASRAGAELGERIWSDAVDRMGEVLARIEAATGEPELVMPDPRPESRSVARNLSEDTVRRFLRCPVDQGALEFGGGHLRCRTCDTRYEIDAGVPVLVADQ